MRKNRPIWKHLLLDSDVFDRLTGYTSYLEGGLRDYDVFLSLEAN